MLLSVLIFIVLCLFNIILVKPLAARVDRVDVEDRIQEGQLAKQLTCATVVGPLMMSPSAGWVMRNLCDLRSFIHSVLYSARLFSSFVTSCLSQ